MLSRKGILGGRGGKPPSVFPHQFPRKKALSTRGEGEEEEPEKREELLSTRKILNHYLKGNFSSVTSQGDE